MNWEQEKRDYVLKPQEDKKNLDNFEGKRILFYICEIKDGEDVQFEFNRNLKTLEKLGVVQIMRDIINDVDSGLHIEEQEEKEND